MDYLVKESTDSKQRVNPGKYDIPFQQQDFYYVSNKFTDVSLNQTDCDALNADPSFNTPEYCEDVFKKPNSVQTAVDKCFQKALCDNKSTAMELIQNTNKKNSSLQNENDHTSFFNVEVLQSFNLGVGILGLISGIVFIFLNNKKMVAS
jgi:hypothetical protein